MLENLAGKTVLVTGGTRGIGLACGLAFARQGARCFLTYRWGPDDERALIEQFATAGATTPILVRADVGEPADTRNLMRFVAEHAPKVDVFVSNATGAVAVRGLDDLTERALASSIRYGAWPTLGYLQEMKRTFGRYPGYTVAISTTGIDSYTRNYDLVAASKAALEVLCRYAAFHLRHEDGRVNLIRTRAVSSDSLKAIVGDDLDEITRTVRASGFIMQPDEVADAVLALCSGFMDDVNGQVITLDRGGLFCDNMSRLFTERERIGL